MIGIQSSGRLGNQLFQFAFLYACHLEHNEPYFVTRYSTLKYFNVSLSKIQNQLNLVKGSLLFRKAYFDPRSEFSGNDLFPSSSSVKRIYFPHSLYSGYFQSLEYFEKYQNEIKVQFEIKQKYKISKLDYKYCAIHIRKGDYQNIKNELLGKDISLPKEYYLNAIEKLALSDEVKLIFVTDDPDWVYNSFNGLKNFEIISNSEISDFQTLIYADFLVLSNSSFSWWAAFLSNLEDTKIIAPDYWMGRKKSLLFPPTIYHNLNWWRI